MVPQISTTGGRPTQAVPLVFVTLVSMVKDLFEDWKRHSQDKLENH